MRILKSEDSQCEIPFSLKIKVSLLMFTMSLQDFIPIQNVIDFVCLI